jgi:hypothetical protein
MEPRETYKQKLDSEIHQITDKLETRVRELGDQARADLRPHLDAVNVRMEHVKEALRRAALATDETWETIKMDADRAYQDVKVAVEHAQQAIAREQQRRKIPHVDGDAPFAAPLPVKGTFAAPAARAKNAKKKGPREAHHHHHQH